MHQNEQLLHFNKGEKIFCQGDDDHSLFIIQSGKVRVYVDTEGKKLPLVDLEKGHVLGEMSFLSSLPRSATAVARESVWVVRYPETLLTENDFALDDWPLCLGRQLVRRLRKTTAELTENLGDVLKESYQPVALGPRGREARKWQLAADSWASRIHLRGDLNGMAMDALVGKIVKMAATRGEPVVLDFSETIDLDQEMVEVIKKMAAGDTDSLSPDFPRVRIDNVQLLQNRLDELEGLKNLLQRKQLPEKTLAPCTVLMKQGEEGSSMFLVRKGKLGIFRENEKGRKMIGTIGPGEIVGEMILIRKGPRSATVESLNESVVAEIREEDFRRNLHFVPTWFMKILEDLVQRLARTTDLLEQKPLL